MNLIGEKVNNITHGVGTIIAIEGDYMTVQFPEKKAKFPYPDAFLKHVTLNNQSLQDEMHAIAASSIEEKKKNRELAKAQKIKETLQSIEAAKNPVKKEVSGKITTSHKKVSSSNQRETIKWIPGKRRTYYCFQGGSFNSEYAGGYIWAPYESDSGMKIHYWDRLKDLIAGDMIFHAVHGNIRAISIVAEPSIIAARPEKLVGIFKDDHRGYLVRCNYTYIDNPINALDYKDQTREYSQVKYAPFNVNGTGNLGYLYELDQRLAKLFLEESIKKNPSLGDITFVKEFLA